MKPTKTNINERFSSVITWVAVWYVFHVDVFFNHNFTIVIDSERGQQAKGRQNIFIAQILIQIELLILSLFVCFPTLIWL